MQLKKNPTSWIYILLPIFYAAGVLWHALDVTLPYMMILTPYTILITAIIGFYFELKHWSSSLALWIVVTFIITFSLEAIGVKTGLIFGAYWYGPTLGFSLFNVPLLIGINWTLIIMGFIIIIKKFTQNIYAVSLLTGGATLLFDYIMEPVAIRYDYWTWEGVAIPLQNYIAWFIIAALFAYLHERMRVKHHSVMPSFVVLVQGLFFLALRLFVI
ncbi:MAG: carotenoid biosynthesis protein [Spirochaetia bacterium]|nr:carotenoid biosynthesis protein [Spirochaetia bacterium]